MGNQHLKHCSRECPASDLYNAISVLLLTRNSVSGKLGEEALFSDFSDHIFFNGVGNWLDLGWGGQHRGAAPTSVPLLLCWPHSAFPSRCWETSQIEVCPLPSGRGDSVIFESPAVTLGTPGWAVLLCSGLYPRPIHATLHCHSGLQKGTGTPVTECLPCPQSSPCHHAVISMASKGQWRCPYSLGGHSGLPALGLGLPGHSPCWSHSKGGSR